MKEIINLFFVTFVTFGLLGCGEKSNKDEVENLDAKSDEVIQLDRPTDADFFGCS